MPEYAWTCLNKQDSEYTYGSKYSKILNMAKFWIWQGSQYASVTKCSEYARICLAWQSSKYISGCEYTSILNLKAGAQGSKFARTWLIMSELDVNTPKDVWIYDNKQYSEYSTYNT